MPLSRLPRATLCALLVVAMPGGTASAQTGAKPRLSLVQAEPRGPADVFLRFRLDGAFNPELATKIQAGLETAIRYDIRLYRHYPNWFDTFLQSRRYRVAAVFDPVTREYVVEETLDGKPLRRTTTRDLDEVKRQLVSRENLLVFRIGARAERRNLYARMRATFDSSYLFTFIPVDSRTQWQNSPRFNILPLRPEFP